MFDREIREALQSQQPLDGTKVTFTTQGEGYLERAYGVGNVEWYSGEIDRLEAACWRLHASPSSSRGDRQAAYQALHRIKEIRRVIADFIAGQQAEAATHQLELSFQEDTNG